MCALLENTENNIIYCFGGISLTDNYHMISRWYNILSTLQESIYTLLGKMNNLTNEIWSLSP